MYPTLLAKLQLQLISFSWLISWVFFNISIVGLIIIEIEKKQYQFEIPRFVKTGVNIQKELYLGFA